MASLIPWIHEKSDGPLTQWVDITPDVALEMLCMNGVNRPLNAERGGSDSCHSCDDCGAEL